MTAVLDDISRTADRRGLPDAIAAARLGDEAYSAAIRRAIEQSTGAALLDWALYTTLDRLETKGLVKTWMGDATPSLVSLSSSAITLVCSTAEVRIPRGCGSIRCRFTSRMEAP